MEEKKKARKAGKRRINKKQHRTKTTKIEKNTQPKVADGKKREGWEAENK